MVKAAQDLRRRATPSEEVLWHALRAKQVGGRRFRRQQPIGPFVVDFFCPSARLVVEVDGAIHDSTVEADRQRQAAIEGLGLRFLRVTVAEVENELPAVVDRIKDAIAVTTPLPLYGGGAGGGGEDAHS
jgi:very-short-patch-repair endonuclease